MPQWYPQAVHAHKAVCGRRCGFLERRLPTPLQLIPSPTPPGRLGHPQNHISEERAHGKNHTPLVLCLQPLSLQGPSTSDSPHLCQRQQHRIVYMRVQGNKKGYFFHDHTNISHKRHSILRLRPQNSPRRNQPGPSPRPLSQSREGHVSESARGKQHHH